MAGVWSSGGNLATARERLAGCGTQSAGLSFGGFMGSNSVVTEEYNGTSWSSGGNLVTGRYLLGGCGTQTAGLSFGGDTSSISAATEEYNGTSWSSGGNLGTARRGPAGCGTQTAGLSFGGYTGSNSTVTEEYNGTSWSSGGALATARRYLAGCGTQTAGLSFGGSTGSDSAVTEEYNGTSWSSGGNLATARRYLAGCGTQSAGLSFGGRTGSNSTVTEEYNAIGWLSGYSKRKKITLTGGSSGTQTAYQLKLTVTYDSDMKSNFDDLRFTKANGTIALDAWLESKTDSTSAIVWVKTDTPANGSTADIYMYYGNSSASSASNAADTFVREISNLVGSWLLDEGTGTSANDTSGNSHTGTLVDAATWATGTDRGTVLSLPDIAAQLDYVDLNFNTNWNVFTIAGWGYKTETHYNDVITKGYYSSSGDCKYVSLGMDYHDDKPYFRVRLNSTDKEAKSATTISNSTWYHIMGMKDSSGNIALYVDGTEKGTNSGAANPNPTQNWKIGEWQNAYGLKGNVAEVLIFNKVLDSNERSDLSSSSYKAHASTNYSGKALIRKFVTNPATYAFGSEEDATSIPVMMHHYRNMRAA